MRRIGAAVSFLALLIAVAWMICEPHFEPLILIIAGIAAFLSQTANEPFSPLGRRLFYDRRFHVYRAAKRFICQVTTDISVARQHLGELIEGTEEARFLFDRTTADFVAELHRKAVRLRYINLTMDRPETPDAQRKLLGAEEEEILRWFGTQEETLKERFAKYLEIPAEG